MRHLLLHATATLLIGLSLHGHSLAETRSVADQTGRQVMVPGNPIRVASLAPSVTEIVFALGQGWRLKGATLFSDYPPESRDLPRIGSYARPDLEKIVALKPDLCLAVKDGNPKPVIDRLLSMGIPVYAMDPRSLKSVMESVLRVGELLGAEGKAQALVRDMHARIERVRTRTATAKRRPRVFFQLGNAPIISAGTNTFVHELINVAGGLNLARGPAAYPKFSLERVLTLSPEIILVSSMPGDAETEHALGQWRQWPAIPAVRDNKIFTVDADLFNRPTPRLVDGLEHLARLIHPDLFPAP
jgi:iron complex transport system substrate-binding protein